MSRLAEGIPLSHLGLVVGVVIDGLLGMGQCAVAPGGKLDKSQEDLGGEAGVEEKFSFVHRCGHAVLIRAGGDSFGGWEDEVRFWQDGWCRVLAKVRWSMSCCTAARAPLGLERRVVALANVGDKLCAATRVATLETPTDCFSFPRHRRRIIGSLRSERTWWSLDRTIVLLPSGSSFLLVCPRLSC